MVEMSRRFEGIISDLRKEVKTEVDEMRGNYVTRAEFEPFKRLLYGGVASILLAVLTAVLALVIRSGH